MNAHVAARKATQTATAATCPWCGSSVATTAWPGETERVYADHPLPAPHGRQRCPASGLTRTEVEPPGGPR